MTVGELRWYVGFCGLGSPMVVASGDHGGVQMVA
jgi:hypothetical protein